MNRSLMFRLYNSSYRGLRFRFHGSAHDAYWVLLGLPVLSLFSAFTLAPLWHQRLKQYQHANASYGQTRFSIDAPIAAFYKAYLLTAAVGTGLLLFALVWLIGAGALLGGAGATAVILIGYVAVGTVLMSLMTAQVRNIVWSHTTLGPYRFGCTLEPHRLVYISLTNLLGIICTLGLYRPFAEVRLTRYLLSELTLIGNAAGLEGFTAGEHQRASAVGEEAAEIFDIDLGL